MKKCFVFVLLILVAMAMAGAYGVIHNQISYTVSPEYFTKFKFQQFGLVDVNLPDRVRASIVGFLASWWMGIFIGLLVGGIAFIHPDHWRMLKVSLWSFLAIVIFTIIFGLCGLLYGWFQTRHINLSDYQGWFIPDNLIGLRRFLCAGYMHNSSYLGGTIGILLAWVIHVVVRIKTPGE